jgi:hypothetical protein
MLYHQILKLESNEYKNDIDLCFTNAKRMEINYIKMKKVYKRATTKRA